VREFNFLAKSVKERARLIGLDAARRLSTRRFLQSLLSGESKGIGVELDEAAPGATLGPSETARLSRQVIDTYVSNVELVKALGEHYRFKSLFYWQPTVSDKPQRTRYENECQLEMQPVARFFSQTSLAFRERQLDRDGAYRVRDLSSLFAQTSIPVFVDRFHLGETGNEIVAKQMLPDVLAELAARPAATKAAAPATPGR